DPSIRETSRTRGPLRNMGCSAKAAGSRRQTKSCPCNLTGNASTGRKRGWVTLSRASIAASFRCAAHGQFRGRFLWRAAIPPEERKLPLLPDGRRRRIFHTGPPGRECAVAGWRDWDRRRLSNGGWKGAIPHSTEPAGRGKKE